jgi:hypothetical protein
MSHCVTSKNRCVGSGIFINESEQILYLLDIDNEI